MPFIAGPVPGVPLDQAIAGIAALQHGLVTTAQLKALGLSSSSISKRTRRGVLHPIHRAVWAVGHRALSERARWMAAVLAVGDDAALGRLAAAKLWNIWRRSVPIVDVVSIRQHRPVPRITVHWSHRLTRAELRRRDRIPVTSVARTMLDLGDVLTPFQLANVIHEAEFRLRFDRRELERLLTRYRGRRAVTVVRQALAIHDGGSAGTFSDLEDEFLALARAHGLDPLVNMLVDVHDGELRPDFHWPVMRLIVEVDGGGHARKRSQEEDRGRDARFAAAGWTVIRCRPSGFRAAIHELERRLGLLQHEVS